MKKCTQTDKPLISIVMAVYKPKEAWFIEQLRSLNNQTYENLELIIWDDCPQEPVSEKLIKNNITNFEYKLYHSEVNQGSTKTFEKLTSLAGGEFISYCDQDDVWLEHKLETLMETAEKTGADLIYSDLYVIDKDGNTIFDSYKAVSKRQKFLNGDNLFSYFIVRCVVLGCTMMVRAEIAKAAIPFEAPFFHDHWIALYVSLNGRICSIEKPLIKYRVHGGNQTGVLNGINTKQDYFDKRIELFFANSRAIEKRFADNEKAAPIVRKLCIWAESRRNYYRRRKLADLYTIIKYINFNKSTALFEILLPFMPNFLFEKLIGLIKEGRL